MSRPRRSAVVLVLLAAYALAACSAAAIPQSGVIEGPPVTAVGPTVRETGARPTGYQVTFRYEAPDAAAVAIVGDVYFTDPTSIVADMSHDARSGDEWRPGDVPHALITGTPTALEQGSDGVWEVSMALPAGVHSYGFVEGECAVAAVCEQLLDPANPPIFADAPGSSSQSLSQVLVPEHPDFATDKSSHLAPVADESARGQLRHVTYPSQQSSRADGEQPLGVYLPPGWDPERAEPYPLLVLSHGAYDNETSWFSQGSAASVLDHAIADGAMPPAVVVTTLFEDLSAADMGEPEFFEAYADELRDSVLPFVEREFHAGVARADRSFGGLSMGGAIGLHLLTEHPDLFAHYGLWSAAADLGAASVAVPTEDQLARMSEAHSIHMGTGKHDALQGIGEKSQTRAAMYSELGLPVMTHDVDGGHSWHVWRSQLDDYVRTVAFSEVGTEPQRRWGWIAVLALGVAVAASGIWIVRRDA